jgi:gamma-glutamyl-gamma-aminobutyraldehyde dehydrogenase
LTGRLATKYILRREEFGPVLCALDDEEVATLAAEMIHGLAISFPRTTRWAVIGSVSGDRAGVDVLGHQSRLGAFRQPAAGRSLSLHALDMYTARRSTWIKHA